MNTRYKAADKDLRRRSQQSLATSLRRAALVLLSVALTSFACGFPHSALPALQRAPIAGDSEIINQFAGRWYDQDALMIVVEKAHPPQLAIRYGGGARVTNAHTVQGGIRFDLVTEERTIELLFQSLGDGVTIVLPTGVSPESAWCGTCNPRLVRSTWMSRTGPRIRRVVREAPDVLMSILIDVLPGSIA